MPTSQHAIILLDNTVLSNFALIGRSDLLVTLWPSCATTFEARQEFITGLKTGKFQNDPWNDLPIYELTPNERENANRLSNLLGLGERSCIAIANSRNGMIVTDDRKARQVARGMGILVTGTLGVLTLDIEMGIVPLDEANQLLRQMIEFGYRSPVTDLQSLLQK